MQSYNKDLVDKRGFSPSSTNYDNRITLFKKNEIVKPYLHNLDSFIINNQIQTSVFKNIKTHKVREEFKKLMPEHLINDIYSLFFNNSNTLKFDEYNRSTKIKFSILDSINNYLIKIVTNNSYLSSYVYSEEIIKFLFDKFRKLPPDEQKNLVKALENSNIPEKEKRNKRSKKNKNEEKSNSSSQETNKNNKNKGEEENNQSGEEGKEKRPYVPPTEDLDEQISSSSDTEIDVNYENPENSFRGAANNSYGENSKKNVSKATIEKIDKSLKDMLSTEESKEQLETAIKNAESKLEKLKEIGINLDSNNQHTEDKDEMREIVQNLDNLDSIKSSLASLNTSKEKINVAIKKVLSNSKNYFSQKCITTDVELFEAEGILDINGIEFLHPAFKKSRIFDLSITERKHIGKTDLYIDCSGSMSSGCGGELNGVSRMNLAKSLAMQMKEMGILGELYEFENNPKKIQNTKISILLMQPGGGTNIETVLKNILITNKNSIILSDGESSINSYTEKAFFIGIGCDFNYFNKQDKESAGRLFIDNRQCISYNGKDFVTIKSDY